MKKNKIKNLPDSPIVGVDINKKGDEGERIEGYDGWAKRVLVFTPTTGLVRMEWVNARHGQITPTNWSYMQFQQYVNPYVPIAYQLPDAQNLMAKKVVEEDVEWVIYIEHDNIIPDDLFLRFNEYINEKKVPIVSGLYFTKSDPPEPVLYRGRGTSYYGDWKLGDKVWVDGIPFGCRLEHASFIKEAWKTAPEYMVGNIITRRVFAQPDKMWYDPVKGGNVAKTGTTDLNWCDTIIMNRLFEKCGWPEYQKMKYPFLVDTTIFVRHIDENGRIFPIKVPEKYLPEDQK